MQDRLESTASDMASGQRHGDTETHTIYLFIGGPSTADKNDVKAQETNDRERCNSSDDHDTDTDQSPVNECHTLS